MAYVTAETLARLLNNVDAAARAADLERVLEAAALEIDKEIGRTLDSSDDAQELALVAEVNLERAVEHWQQGQSPFGLLGLGSDTGPVFASTDSWERHARKLAPLKVEWGLA